MILSGVEGTLLSVAKPEEFATTAVSLLDFGLCSPPTLHISGLSLVDKRSFQSAFSLSTACFNFRHIHIHQSCLIWTAGRDQYQGPWKVICRGFNFYSLLGSLQKEWSFLCLTSFFVSLYNFSASYKLSSYKLWSYASLSLTYWWGTGSVEEVPLWDTSGAVCAASQS